MLILEFYSIYSWFIFSSSTLVFPYVCSFFYYKITIRFLSLLSKILDNRSQAKFFSSIPGPEPASLARLATCLLIISTFNLQIEKFPLRMPSSVLRFTKYLTFFRMFILISSFISGHGHLSELCLLETQS